MPDGAIPTVVRLGGARPALPEHFAPLAGLSRTAPPVAPAPLAAPLPVPRPVATLPPVPVPAEGLPLLLSLGLHLAPLGLLLGIVSGVVSDGGAGGGGSLVAAQSAEPLMVELVADWTKPAPPPVAFSAAPALPAPQAAEPPPPPVAVAMAGLAPAMPAPPPPGPTGLVAPRPEPPPQLAPPPPPPPAPPPVAEAVAEAAPPSPPPPLTKPRKRPDVVDPPQRAADPPKAEVARTEAPPAPKPQAAPEAPQRDTAAGGTVAQAEGTGPAAPSAARLDDLKSGWGAKIRARIERRKDYPAAADGAAGKVTLALVVARDGRLVGVDIAASSGNAALDRAALKAVERAGRFPAAPRALADAQYAFALAVSFKP